ncbi:hypothetical protein QYM36_002551 [Artemia franciscana]|uniref:Reverse transcriptase domain-containing protein n=1 Tax=Artemia franciscana TaxID=6661 RepID=A0AA88I563_ARTSF|nr:hypothetical protein QYM36_002551 [Artemia franciscana]
MCHATIAFNFVVEWIMKRALYSARGTKVSPDIFIRNLDYVDDISIMVNKMDDAQAVLYNVVGSAKLDLPKVKTKEAFMVIRSQPTHTSSKSLSGPSSEPEVHKALTVFLHDSKPYDISSVTELQDVLNSGQKILKTEVTILPRFSATDQSDYKNDGPISNTKTQIRNPGSAQELDNSVASCSERKQTGSATLSDLQANRLALNPLDELYGRLIRGVQDLLMEDKIAEDLIIVAKYSTDARAIIQNL